MRRRETSTKDVSKIPDPPLTGSEPILHLYVCKWVIFGPTPHPIEDVIYILGIGHSCYFSCLLGIQENETHDLRDTLLEAVIGKSDSGRPPSLSSSLKGIISQWRNGRDEIMGFRLSQKRREGRVLLRRKSRRWVREMSITGTPVSYKWGCVSWHLVNIPLLLDPDIICVGGLSLQLVTIPASTSLQHYRKHAQVLYPGPVPCIFMQPDLLPYKCENCGTELRRDFERLERTPNLDGILWLPAD